MECCGKCKYYKKLGEDTFICQTIKAMDTHLKQCMMIAVKNLRKERYENVG